MSNTKHIAYLDSIRGLAALAVINEHFVIAYGLPCKDQFCQRILDYSPLHIWWDGGAAVSMFFVLSGFVLVLKYFRDTQHPDLNKFQLTSFVIGRLFRIWLPYVGLVVLCGFLYRYTFETSTLKTELMASDWIISLWRSHPLNFMDMLREAFLLKLPPLVVLLPQSWTLSIELVLSLLLPIGLLLAERGLIWLVLFSLFTVFLLGVSPFLLHFLLGLIIARHYKQIVDYLSQRTLARSGVLFLGLVLYTSGNTVPKIVGETLLWLSSGLGAGLIILYVLSSKNTQSVLSNIILRQMGKVSYSAYLLHIAVLLCLTPYLLKALEFVTLNQQALWLGGLLLTIVVVQLLACVFYYVLERPSINLGRKLLKIKFCRLNPSGNIYG